MPFSVWIALLTLAPAAMSKPPVIDGPILDSPSVSMRLGGGTAGEENVTHACQGTLIARTQIGKLWNCVLATAAHCVDTAPTFFLTTLHGPTPILSIELKAADRRGFGDDLAVIRFGTGCEKWARVVPLHSGTFTNAGEGTQEVYLSSRALERLNKGSVRLSALKEPGAFKILSLPGDPAFQGDSGGGIFVYQPATKQLELMGVLVAGSTSGKSWEDVKAKMARNIGSYEIFASYDLPWLRAKMGGTVPAAAKKEDEPAVGRIHELDSLLLK